MKYAMHNMLPFRTTLCMGIALTSFATRAAAAQTYCSTQNTGSDFSSVTDLYQSNGRCTQTCQGYAFAVVQFQQCWCSNYIPASTTDLSDCSENCPGYPFEQCGRRASGLYGYIKLDASPSGTAGASSAQSTQQSSTAAPSTTEDSTTSYTSPTRSSSTSAESETSWVTMDPVTSVVMTTISGAVVTQTVTSTPVVAPNSHSDSMQISRDDGLGAGAIAGIVIGVLAALALLGLAAFLLWRRRRNVQPDGEEKAPGAGGKNLGRNVSVLSKAGLLARTRTSMVEHDNDFFAPAPGQNSNRHSLMFGPLGLGGEGVSPTSPLGSSDGSNHSRRASRPMVYDQRLNPSALFANAEANGSRVSIQDQQDYSRPIHGLAVMNPDPRPSFESRNSHRGA